MINWTEDGKVFYMSCIVRNLLCVAVLLGHLVSFDQERSMIHIPQQLL